MHNSDLYINCKSQSILIHFCLRILVFIGELGRKKIKVVGCFSAWTAYTKRKPIRIGNIMFLKVAEIYQETCALTWKLPLFCKSHLIVLCYCLVKWLVISHACLLNMSIILKVSFVKVDAGLLCHICHELELFRGWQY